MGIINKKLMEEKEILVERYQVEEKLKSGAFGQPFKCTDLETSKIVLIKVINSIVRGIPPEYIRKQYHIVKNLKHKIL